MSGASPLILAKDKKKNHTKKSEQSCGKKKFQNIAGVTIQLLHKINVPLKWSRQRKGEVLLTSKRTCIPSCQLAGNEHKTCPADMFTHDDEQPKNK